MNAVEFVKKFGIDRTKYWIKEFTEINKLPDEMINIEFLNDLKHLIESHELVKAWQLPEDDKTGLDGAHLYLDCYACYTSDEEKAKLDRLNQAVADVEACQ